MKTAIAIIILIGWFLAWVLCKSAKNGSRTQAGLPQKISRYGARLNDHKAAAGVVAIKQN